MFSFSKVFIKEKKIHKRQVVVLKSPFHYKLPKHHLTYNFFITVCKCYVDAEYAEFLVKATTSVFFLINISKVQIGIPSKINLTDLVL